MLTGHVDPRSPRSELQPLTCSGPQGSIHSTPSSPVPSPRSIPSSGAYLPRKVIVHTYDSSTFRRIIRRPHSRRRSLGRYSAPHTEKTTGADRWAMAAHRPPPGTITMLHNSPRRKRTEGNACILHGTPFPSTISFPGPPRFALFVFR